MGSLPCRQDRIFTQKLSNIGAQATITRKKKSKGTKNMNGSEKKLKKKHEFADHLYWNLVLSVPVITACMAILKDSVLWFIFYALACLSLVISIYRVFCSHCPHYIQGHRTTKCMFLWGIPKFFKSRPEPLNLFEKAVSIMAPTVMILLPVYWLAFQLDLLVIYSLSLGVLFSTIRRNECGRCIHFHCPVNCVPEDKRHHT